MENIGELTNRPAMLFGPFGPPGGLPLGYTVLTVIVTVLSLGSLSSPVCKVVTLVVCVSMFGSVSVTGHSLDTPSNSVLTLATALVTSVVSGVATVVGIGGRLPPNRAIAASA